MIRKFFTGVAVAGLLSIGTAISVLPAGAQEASAKQEQRSTKSISGKISSIGNGGHSFSLEVTGESKNTMNFVVDKNTQVNGQVREGTTVTVEYHPDDSGQNVAVSITAQA